MKHPAAVVLAALVLAPGALAACGGAEDPTPIGTASDSLVGDWTGYVENFVFDDTTDTVALSLESIGESGVTGHVRFGTRPMYPSATDPDVGYPDGYRESEPFPFTGFTFTIVEGTFDGQRLKFSIDANEIWNEWCAMQTPLADETNVGNYSCVHNWGFEWGDAGCSQPDPETGEKIPIDCGKLFLCDLSYVCGCSEQACSANGQHVTFDIEADVDEADGSIAGIGGAPVNIRLTR